MIIEKMDERLDYIVKVISERNEIHGKKIKKNIEDFDEAYFDRVSDFLVRLERLLEKRSKSLDYAIDCYLKMLADVTYDTIDFMRTGKYSSTSFAEVNERVYGNPEVMEYYMYGLLLSQFLWSQHYDILKHFNKIIKETSVKGTYLEIGAGHGLYVREAIELLDDDVAFDVVDISPSSIKIGKEMIDNPKVNYHLTDIFDFEPEKKYDFITMGEVLEHVEEPVKLLQRLYDLLADDGKFYITTPTNAPAIDHIYLFRNAEEIREVIHAAGFEIEQEACYYSEKLPEKKLIKFKVSMMYAGLLTKRK